MQQVVRGMETLEISRSYDVRWPCLRNVHFEPPGGAAVVAWRADAQPASSIEQCVVGCECHRPVSTSRSKMAVSVFPGVRLLSIGDANGDIQRHSEQQPLRLEVKSTQDAAFINLSNGELTFSGARMACLSRQC